MNDHLINARQGEQWLRNYYFTRAAFSVAWFAVAFLLGAHSPVSATILLIGYPGWDALANYVDMRLSGGKTENSTQTINIVISLIATAAVLLDISADWNWTLGVFGLWAILAGLLQLGTAVRRWKQFGAQWAMVLSGAQSAVAGALFLSQAHTPLLTTITRIAGYAGVGALYFLISAMWLLVSAIRRQRVTTP